MQYLTYLHHSDIWIQKKKILKQSKPSVKNLKNEGILIIDFFNTKKIISNLVESKKKDYPELHLKSIEKSKKVFKNIQFTDGGKNLNLLKK